MAPEINRILESLRAERERVEDIILKKQRSGTLNDKLVRLFGLRTAAMYTIILESENVTSR
jgi:Mg2+ and Co2+ transporter CorA